MKPKSLCFTGEADCLVYPNYRYSSLLRPALVTGKRLNYLPTEEGEEERGRKKQREREREAFHTWDEIFILFFFYEVMSKARLMIHEHLIQVLITKEKGILAYRKWKIRPYGGVSKLPKHYAFNLVDEKHLTP